jgi:hypothetical protein
MVRRSAFISGALLAVIILLAVAGNMLEAAGADPAVFALPAKPLFFALFVAFGYSAIPLIVRSVVMLNIEIGTAIRQVPLVRNERPFIWAGWVLLTLGLVAGLPFAVGGGLFGEEAAQAMATLLEGSSQGVLTANIGMTGEEMRRRSTLAMSKGIHQTLTGSTIFAGEGVFTFELARELAGTGLRFERSRYYFIETGDHDDPHLVAMSIGIMPRKADWAGLVAAREALRARLRENGWAAGRYVYRTEEMQRLMGGAKTGGEGDYWLKGDTVLRILVKRMDDAKPDEGEHAGEWLQYLELRGRADYLRRNPMLEFTPP